MSKIDEPLDEDFSLPRTIIPGIEMDVYNEEAIERGQPAEIRLSVGTGKQKVTHFFTKETAIKIKDFLKEYLED